MTDAMEEKGKQLEVEPAAEGPKVKAKRVLTEAQLEALKLGRSKLAEKRKMTAVVSSSAEEKKEVIPPSVEEPEIGWAAAPMQNQEPSILSQPKEELSSEDSYQLCSIM